MQKAIFQIGLKNFLLLQKLKILFRGHVTSDVKGKKNAVIFNKKEIKKQKKNQKEFRVEKVIKKKVINYMLNRKVTIVLLIVELIKKT